MWPAVPASAETPNGIRIQERGRHLAPWVGVSGKLGAEAGWRGLRNASAEMKTASLTAVKGVGGEAVHSTKAVPLF